jgi:hypothetical protein
VTIHTCLVITSHRRKVKIEAYVTKLKTSLISLPIKFFNSPSQERKAILAASENPAGYNL